MSDTLLVALTREADIVSAAARACARSVTPQISGMGPIRARIAAQCSIAGGASALLSVGFAGAVRAPLRVGDLLLPREVLDAAGQRFAADTNMHERLCKALEARFVVHHGAMGSVAEVLDEAARKQTVAGALDVDAVDMESAAIARVARDAGIPFAVLRVVCDGPQQGLPRCIDGAVDAYGRVIVARLAISLALRPWQLPGLLRLGGDAARAGRSLERALCAVFSQVCE